MYTFRLLRPPAITSSLTSLWIQVRSFWVKVVKFLEIILYIVHTACDNRK